MVFKESEYTTSVRFTHLKKAYLLISSKDCGNVIFLSLLSRSTVSPVVTEAKAPSPIFVTPSGRTISVRKDPANA